MERRLNLIKTDFEKHEKRILPRFPFCYLTFKTDQNSRVYEIKDISHSGMQLSLKDNDGIEESSTISGKVHWLGKEMVVAGNVKWKTNGRIGIEFNKRQDLAKNINNFLSDDSLVSYLKPLHKTGYGLELPSKLKIWLRSDGPVEVFVWNHSDGEFAKIQVLLLENFIEWTDGEGLKTGRILSKRNVDTPLLDEDEVVFLIDAEIDTTRVERARDFISKISSDLLSRDTQDFILLKLE
jgi:hypothetical protein